MSGASGSLGEAYLDYYRTLGCDLIGLSRTVPNKKFENVTYFYADLLNQSMVKNMVHSLNLEGITNITYVHPVGKFKFEEKFQNLDQKVYDSNVQTFVNLVEPLLELNNPSKTDKRRCNINLVAFGSISDKYNVPFWKSYSYSKNVLRMYMYNLSCQNDDVKSLFINLSSVKTRNESKLRPYANTSYWITTEEIVMRSVKEFSFLEKWKEIDIFNVSPNYSPEIYTNHTKIFERWMEEMYG